MSSSTGGFASSFTQSYTQGFSQGYNASTFTSKVTENLYTPQARPSPDGKAVVKPESLSKAPLSSSLTFANKAETTSSGGTMPYNSARVLGTNGDASSSSFSTTYQIRTKGSLTPLSSKKIWFWLKSGQTYLIYISGWVQTSHLLFVFLGEALLSSTVFVCPSELDCGYKASQKELV